MAYPHKWSPISYKSGAGQRKHIGQRPMLCRWTTQPTNCRRPGPHRAISAQRHPPGRERETTGHRLRSASSVDLIAPVTGRSTMDDCAFTVAGRQTWNSLSHAVRRSPSPAVFKRSLETQLLSCYPAPRPRRSIAKPGGCFQRRLSVCLFVCPLINFRTTKHRTIKLGG